MNRVVIVASRSHRVIRLLALSVGAAALKPRLFPFVVAACLLAACSTADAESPASDQRSLTPTAEPAASSGGSDGDETRSIDSAANSDGAVQATERVFNLLLSPTNDESAEDDLRFEEAVQDRIGPCMRANGFEWVEWTLTLEQYEALRGVPADPIAWTPASQSEPDYGIVVDYAEDLLAEAVLNDVAASPNDVIRSALSGAEAEAYDETLFGERGCGPSAADAVRAELAVAPGLQPAESEILGRYRDELISGGVYAAIVDDWARCMRETGYDDLGTPNDLYGYFDRWIREASLAVGIRTSDSGYEVVIFDVEALDRLQADERRLALADSTCRTSSSYSERLAAEAHRLAALAVDELGW